MSNSNDIIKTEKRSFITTKENSALAIKCYLWIFCGIIVVLIIGIVVSFNIDVKGLKSSCIVWLLIVFVANSILLTRFYSALTMSKRRVIAEEKGEYFSGKLLSIEEIKNSKQYVVKVEYEEDGHSKTFISPQYVMNPREFLVEGANCILVKYNSEIWIDSNQVKKTEYTGDWLEHFTVNSNGDELAIPVEQRFREWVGEGDAPTGNVEELKNYDFEAENVLNIATTNMDSQTTDLPVKAKKKKKKGQLSDKEYLEFARMKELFNSWITNGVPEDISDLKMQEVNFLIAFYDSQRVRYFCDYFVGRKKYKVKRRFRETRLAKWLIVLLVPLMAVAYTGLIGKMFYICFLMFTVLVFGSCVSIDESRNGIIKKMDAESHELKFYYKKKFHKNYISNTKYHEKITAWLGEI